MAGNKINNKKKDEKNKLNRITSQGNDENDEIDFSLLRKPILTNITGFAQARKIFDQATEELKSLLTNECDILYECKVCRNIFRSLVNFISHKRVYCKENFSTSIHGHFLKESSSIHEVLKIRKLENDYQESLKEINRPSLEDDDSNERIPITKDLTEIIDKMVKHKGVKDEYLEEQQLVFQEIPKTSVAVYQNLSRADDEISNDSMKTQVKELDEILSQENAVLQSDGSFKVQSNSNISTNTDNVIQISDDDENDTDVLKCRICDLQFSTQKTLKFHMKYKHLESRLVYPCPDCLDIFSTSWSVYRHLFKVHRKTAAQIRRLRESIQAKAFRMNNPPAFYEKRKTVPKNVPLQKITEEERLEQENQAWLVQMDGEGEGRRCGGCGRTFERRAALASHAHTCTRRDRRRIQIQIRKDYHKRPADVALPPPRVAPQPDNVTDAEEKEIAVKIEENDTKDEDLQQQLTEAVMTVMGDKEADEEKEMDTDDTVVLNKTFFYDNTYLLINKLPFAQQAEKSNLKAFKQRIQVDTEIDNNFCKKCKVKFDKFSELLDHMAAHYKWMRYACKLCNYKNFNFEKLPEHVKVVHKLKGDTDFYYSTVKAIDGAEAVDLAETDEPNEPNTVSPDSRRPSRCSSDSSRLSDDSSSSNTRIEGSRKRKANRYRNNLKKKKENVTVDMENNKADETQKDVPLVESISLLNSKIFEENSSDMDDVDEKISKRVNIEVPPTVASRRPVRNKTKPKNEDFEYDLSNLLKMEAQGYRDSQIVSTKTTQSKKKQQIDLQQNYDLLNKDCCGALVTLSRKSVEKAQSHMKTVLLFNTSKETRISSVFARPMTPRIAKVDKISPKKEEKEIKDSYSPINSKEKETKDSYSSINSKEKVIKDSYSSINSKEKEIKDSHSSINSKEKEIKDSYSPINSKETEIKDSYSSINSKEKEIKDSSINSKEKEIKDSYSSINSKEKEIKDLRSPINSKEKEIKDSYSSINSKEKVIKDSCSSINSKEKEIKGSYNSINSKEKDIKDSYSSINSKEKEIKESHSSISLKEKEIEDSFSSIKIDDSSTLPCVIEAESSNKTSTKNSEDKESKSSEPEIVDSSENKSVKDNYTDNISLKNNEVKDIIVLDKPKSVTPTTVEVTKSNLNLPIVPIKFRQSMEVIKNPLIKKNITDFTKAGMKTKILVIKPINRNPDGTQSLNTPLKFQTIKLKDPNKCNALNEDKKDQVVVVQVPKVECSVTRPITSNIVINETKSSVTDEVKTDDEKASQTPTNETETIVPEEECIPSTSKASRSEFESTIDSCDPVIEGTEAEVVMECDTTVDLEG